MAKTALGFELANERMIIFSYIAVSLIIPLLASILCTLFFRKYVFRDFLKAIA